jgi:hypothetical protein
MKLFLLSLICVYSFGQNDKASHFIAGGLAGYYGASLELSMTNNVHPYLVCIGSATLAGTAKELMDRQTTGFDRKDLGATIAGGILSGTIIYLVKRRYARKKAKLLFR